MTGRGNGSTLGVAIAGLAALAIQSAPAYGQGICGVLQDVVLEASHSGADQSLLRAIDRKERQVASVTQEMERNGCGGSVIIIRGSEGDVCPGLSQELATLEYDLTEMLRVLVNHADRTGHIERAELKHEMNALGCTQAQASTQHASYSQFRRPLGRGSIIEIRESPEIDAEIQSASLGIDDRTELEKPEGAKVASAGAMTQSALAAPNLIDLEERLAERDVRVVGPKFFPDPSEAIDLRSPVPTFDR